VRLTLGLATMPRDVNARHWPPPKSSIKALELIPQAERGRAFIRDSKLTKARVYQR
jgi:hypothetical protein